jgi:beta-glucosidase-like glycosyl hydrolase
MLREQWHYHGVVISDDMQMGAIAQYSGYEQVVLLARRGGRGRARNGESTPGGS